MKRILIGVVLTLVIALVGSFVLIRSGLVPANADAQPSQLETWMASTSLNATLLRNAPKDPNPVPLTDQNLLDGVKLFAQNCAVCHGSAKGETSRSPLAKGLYQKPPQFATDGVEDDPEGVSFWKIKHGIRLTGMPSFGYSLDDREIWTIALFLKHMDKLPPAAEQTWQQVRNWPLVTLPNTTAMPVEHAPSKQ
jgi:mono/diheme cytochrome c family protein